MASLRWQRKRRLPVERTCKIGQTYSVQLDAAACGGESVRIRQVFRVVTPKWGHRLYFELPQPCRRLSLSIDYTNTDIAHLTISDTVATRYWFNDEPFFIGHYYYYGAVGNKEPDGKEFTGLMVQ